MKIYMCLFAAILFQSGSAINPCVIDCTASADGRFPDCNSCAKYHVCSSGLTTTENCDAGFLYDVISETCQPQAQTVCGNNLNSVSTDCTTDCSNVGTGQFPYCGDCGKYIVCNNGIVEQQLQCPNNDVYNLLFLSCTPLNGAVCGYNPLLPFGGNLQEQAVPDGFQVALDQMSPNDARLSSVVTGTQCTSDCKDVAQNGAFPFCGSCSTFVVCVNNEIYKSIMCPNNLKFDSINLRCDFEAVAVCGTPTETTSKAPSPGVTPKTFIIADCIMNSCNEIPGIGHFPICNACDKSVFCFGGVPNFSMCNAGLLFDAVTKRCTFPRFASCALKAPFTSPATSPITSPSTPPVTSPATSPKTSPTIFPTTSPVTSPKTTPTSTSTGITPKKTVVTKCSTDCSNIYGVRYVPVCDDCSRGLFCAYGRIRNIIQCSSGFLYDFITRVCKRPEFTTCGIGGPDDEPATTTTKPDPDCITNCNGRANGLYHSCFGCRYYARCYNGFLGVRFCPSIIGLPLFFDDSVKNCVIRSSTCSAIGK